MNQKSKAVLAVSLAAAVALAFLVVGGWWIAREFGSAIPPQNVAGPEAADEQLLDRARPQVAPIPKPVNLDALQPLTTPTPSTPLAKPVALNLAPADTPAAANIADSLQRQMDQLANDDDLLSPGEKARRFVMSLCRDQQGRIWVGCEDSGVWCYDPAAESAKQWTQFTRKSTGGLEEPNGATGDGGTWLGDDNGYALACDKLGRIWVGHLNHGVSVFNGGSWRNYSVLDGPLGERVFAIAVCPTDGDVWIATNAGLTRYSTAKDTWVYYTRAEGLPSDQASAIAFDKQGNIIVGTQCDGVAFASAKDDYKTWRIVSAVPEYRDRVPLVSKGSGLPTNQINDVLVTRDGTIYVATTTGLAWSKDGGRSFEFVRGQEWAEKVKGLYGGPPTGWQETGKGVLHEDYLTCLAEEESGILLVGGWRKGCGLYDTRTQHFKVLAGMSAAERLYGRSFTSAILATPGMPTELGVYGSGLARIAGKTSTTPASGDVAGTSEYPALPRPMGPPTSEELKAMLETLSKVPPMDATAPKVMALPSDWMTRGNWLGRYGRYWACLAAAASPRDILWGPEAAQLVYSARIGPHRDKGDGLRYWIQWSYTSNPGALELPLPYQELALQNGLTKPGATRRYAEWDDHSEAYPATMDGPHI